MTSSAASVLPSYLETVDSDPYSFYDRAREAGDVIWDDGLNGWIVTSYALCREVMREDKKLVRHTLPDMPDDHPVRHVIGRRSRHFTRGDEHARHHRWFVRRFSYNVVDIWRSTLIRPILDRILDDIVRHGRIEFAGEYTYRFSVRVIAGVLGLPWEDDAWIDRCKRLLDRKQRYVDTFFNADETTIADAMAASDELDELIAPYIEAARHREPREDDIMALLWAEGPTIMHDWSVADVNSWVSTTFFAGTDTTTHAIENALYLLLTIEGLQDDLRARGDEGLARFTEEVLRLYGAVQFVFRSANQEFALGGVTIKEDDKLFILDSCANRDPHRFAAPDEIDLGRDAWREHLAFTVGPHTCAGAALARAEIQEAVGKALERLPNLRLDPSAEQPSYHGFILRSYRPLHALFDPSRPE